MFTGQPELDNSSLQLSFQTILGYAKLTETSLHNCQSTLSKTLLAVSWVFVVCFSCVDMHAYQEMYTQKSNWRKGNFVLELGVLAGKNRYLI